MGTTHRIDLGESFRLALQLEDGGAGLFPRATIYNGSVVPVAAVDLDHTALGLYRKLYTPAAAKEFDVVYRVFTDAGRTTESDYERVTEKIVVTVPPDEPWLGVVYDDLADDLLVNVHLMRRGARVTANLTSCTVTVYDADDSVFLGPVTDNAADGEGVFRFSFNGPGLTDDRNYVVKIEVALSTHTVLGQKGFKAVP
jgi:hypothetical protein